jgi:hypothetical protein
MMLLLINHNHQLKLEDATIVPRQARDEHEANFNLKFKRFRRQAAFADAFAAQVEKQKLDVLICPAHVLPTCPHGTTGDFVQSASYQVRNTNKRGVFWLNFLIENNHFAKRGSSRGGDEENSKETGLNSTWPTCSTGLPASCLQCAW